MKKLEVAINGTTRIKDANTGSLTVGAGKTADQVHIGFMTGTGDKYRRIEEPQVSIWVEGKPVWEGDFATLKSLLSVEGYAKTVKGPYDKDYTLELITDDFVFYGNLEEGDDNANTMIFTRNMELRSDNYFANGALFEEFEKPLNDASFVWQSNEFKENHRLHKEANEG